MANSAQSTGLDIGHPAPERDHIAPAFLVFVLIGPAVGWSVQLLVAFASTSYLCVGGIAVPGWMAPTIVGLNVVSLAVAAASLILALNLFRQTAHEHRDRSGNVVDAGEGRTRFLAVWGTVISLVFLVAILASSLSLFLVPSCAT